MSQNCSHLSKGAVNLEKAPDVWELREGYKTHLGFRSDALVAAPPPSNSRDSRTAAEGRSRLRVTSATTLALRSQVTADA
ncbi:Arf-Gap With Rho-Gap Domain, Ank Repeat And Ph Domain-Containing Protein 1 [Manis pentadactyla]|nr:Arf-Gap With Rho-Gap Domain, Ank Repeat And Ph Domain-Containing Protein 1 [Manis pentadactyla]